MKLTLTEEDVHEENPRPPFWWLTPAARLATVAAGGATLQRPTGDVEVKVPRLFEAEPDGVIPWGPHDRNNGGVKVTWSGPTGFGEVDAVVRKDGCVQLDSETYGREFVAIMLTKVAMAAQDPYSADVPETRYRQTEIQNALEETHPEHTVKDFRIEAANGTIAVLAEKDGQETGLVMRFFEDTDYIDPRSTEEQPWTAQ